MKTDQEQQFENWFKQQPFYSQQVFSHGERLFIKDEHGYKVVAVQTAWAAWCSCNSLNQYHACAWWFFVAVIIGTWLAWVSL